MKPAKKFISLFLVLVLAMCFCSCRVRTTKTGSSQAAVPINNSAHYEDNEEKKDKSENKNASQNDTFKKRKKDISNEKTGPSNNASNDKKRGKASAEIKNPDNKASDVIKDASDKDKPSDNEGTNSEQADDNGSGNINDEKEDDSERTDLTEKDDKVEEKTPTQVAVEKYDKLISLTNAELYECQKVNVYFELVEDCISVSRHTEIHSMIEKAGGYNVAEIKNSEITDEWIADKNPDMIVKLASGDILGSGIWETEPAEHIVDRFFEKTEFYSVPAVQSKNILILSSSLFEIENGDRFARLCLAVFMYPALYSELDLDLAYEELTGNSPDGIYYFYLG